MGSLSNVVGVRIYPRFRQARYLSLFSSENNINSVHFLCFRLHSWKFFPCKIWCSKGEEGSLRTNRARFFTIIPFSLNLFPTFFVFLMRSIIIFIESFLDIRLTHMPKNHNQKTKFGFSWRITSNIIELLGSENSSSSSIFQLTLEDPKSSLCSIQRKRP